MGAMGNAHRIVVVLLAVMAGCSSPGSGECVDEDGDEYKSGAGCEPADCDDTDPLHHSDCGTCSDPDRDGRGVGCDPGPDCDPTDPAHWADCGACTDADLDGRGEGCDLGADCDDGDPDVWGACGACTDGDGDAHFTGCDAYTNRPGPDCDDGDADNWLRCNRCADNDGDGQFSGCDAYGSNPGPDCDDDDPDNWTSCSSCRDADSDGYHAGCDGYSALSGPDCDDTTPLHWSDCGSCADGDGDGRGAGCDLGSDCGDADRDNWTSCATCADQDTDGRYAGCDAYFNTVGPDCDDSDIDVWSSCNTCGDFDGDGWATGCDAYVSTPGPDCNDGDRNNWAQCATCRDQDSDGRYTDCDSYSTISGPDCGDLDPNNWDSCATCADADSDGRWAGCDAYVTVAGPDCDPADPLHWSDCGMCTDSDGDGRGTGCDIGSDCDDTSDQHWSDCGLCTDGDNDGYGTGCDLGPDCDDANENRNPGLPDPTRDGVDQNCDGIDGPGIFDDFDDGVLAPVWTASGDSGLTTAYASSGSYSLNLGGGGGLVVSTAFDTSNCTSIVWQYQGKRGPEDPDAGEFLRLEYWNGTGWIATDTWFGSTVTDPTFSARQGFITDADALSSSFQVRFTSDGSGTGTDDFYVDDMAIGCASDGDLDGVPDGLDCAPADDAHWSDCGSCVDGDNDDYGTACDLGTDCNDGDPNVNPGEPDPTVDGTDQNCDGVDGPISTQTYSASPALAVTDGGGASFACGSVAAVSDVITVPTTGTIYDVNVSATFTHGRGADLDVFLQFENAGSPICIELTTDNGAGADFAGTIFDDEATTPITTGSSPFSGSFSPEAPLSSLDALSMTGDFTLWVSDDFSGTAGTLDAWSITIEYY